MKQECRGKRKEKNIRNISKERRSHGMTGKYLSNLGYNSLLKLLIAENDK